MSRISLGVEFAHGASLHGGKSCVELGQQSKALFRRTTRRHRTKAGFRVELRDANGGKFLKEFVDAHLAVLGKLADAGVFVFWKTDCQGAHKLNVVWLIGIV